ncbi:MAG: sialidase family protein [Armatimonadota bacterium]
MLQITNDSVITLSLPHGDGNPRNSEGSFVALADGRIMFVYTHYYGHSWADEATAYLAARYSSDGGATWTTQDRIVVENEGDQNVMSTSLLRLQDGRIALFYLRKNSDDDCQPYLRASTDEGETWSEPTLCSPIKGYYCLLNDQAVQLSTGRIILPVSSHRITKEKNAGSSIVYFLSDDAGQSWRQARDTWIPQVRGESMVAEPGIVERRDGSLYCYARTGLGRQWESTSPDGGESWSAPQRSRFRCAQAPMNIKRIPAAGDLLAVWNDLTPRWGVPKKKLVHGWANDSSWGRTPLVAAISKDDGYSWRHAQAVETDPYRGFCYPAIHFTEDAALLAYCCGGPDSGVLQDLCIRRIPLERLYR